MSDVFDQFKPGTLWQTIVGRSREALAGGALQPIATDSRVVDDHGVQFEIHVVSSLVRKLADGKARWPASSAPNGGADPFLPYEQELFVANVSDTHLCLLNKYNVIDHHALIVTRAFEPQEDLLNHADFEALWYCMAEFNALGFYNSGPVAGASQPHKHLQLVPLPLSAAVPDVALAALFDPPSNASTPMRIARLPFAHSFAWLDGRAFASVTVQAAYAHTLYREMLVAVGVDAANPRISPYNLLVTRRFMLLIPRRLERYESIAVNALGFAGSFFVAEQKRLEAIERIGPMEILRQVSFPN